MRFHHPVRSRPGRRGKVLALTVLLLPVFLGMTGLVIDGGILMATQRQVQNTADAAAAAAAMDLLRGASSNTALTTANTFMTGNGLGTSLALNSGTSNTLNVPPASGPYAGVANYSEAVVTKTVNTFFIQILTGTSSVQVSARAVAGFEPVGSGEGAIVLDPTIATGIQFKGNNAQIIVNGTVVVNAGGGGIDQYGNTVTTLASGGSPISGGDAVATHASPSIVATDIQVVGGVDTLNNFREYDPAFSPTYFDATNPNRPVFARAEVAPDPLLSVPTPNSTNNPWYNVVNPPVSGNTYSPGVYTSSIKVTGTAVFSPGIYVLSGGDLSISGGGNITGSGVMFYFTNGTYNATTGAPDSSDGSTNPGTNAVSGSTLSMAGNPSVSLTPYNDPSSPFNGLLFYSRRWNTSSPKLTGNGGSVNLAGTIYAKWAQFELSGQGTYSAQFVVGSLLLSGNGNITINGTGKNFGLANLVFLVE